MSEHHVVSDAIDTAWRRIRSLDVGSVASASGLAAAAAQAAVVQAWLDGFTSTVARRAGELCQEGAGPTPSDLLHRNGRMRRREARRIERRAEVLSAVPQLRVALDAGRLSAAHVDALADVAARTTEGVRAQLFDRGDVLVEAALGRTPEQFERFCRHLVDELDRTQGIDLLERQRRATHVRRWIDDATGMYVLHGEFDPETGARIFTALDAELDARWHAQHPGDEVVPELARANPHLAAHALAGLVTGGHAAARPGIAELVVLVDLATLRVGRHDHSVCELHDGTEVPVELARRLACDAEILPAVLSGAGAVLDLGRSQRLASRAQRRALRSMYRTCAFDGCTVPFHHCEVHHVVEWERLGTTDLANLVPLCSQHHHLVHEGGWRLRLDADRTLVIHRPDGLLHATVPLPPLAADPRARPGPVWRPQATTTPAAASSATARSPSPGCTSTAAVARRSTST